MDAILDSLLDPFRYAFMIRALFVSVLVGIVCPVLGGFVVTRGLGFMGDALAHAVLPALVIAFLVGASPFVAAVPAGVGVALLIGYLSRRTGISEDTSIGVMFAGMFALGLVLLTAARGISVDLDDLLLGQVLDLGIRHNDHVPLPAPRLCPRRRQPAGMSYHAVRTPSAEPTRGDDTR